MNEDELVHELVNSLAFEVEAIPTDNIIKFTSTNGTPLNVKVRVRNKDEPRLIQRGIVSVPKLGKHIASVDKIRLISSDQTILSFNVYMETELEKQSPPKNRKHGFKFFKLGGCLGTSYDEDEEPYLPGPSSKKGLRSRTSSKSDSDIHAENVSVAEKLKLELERSKAPARVTTGDQKKLFGKCKPGGCLDPPFGEDKEPYRPASAQKPVSKAEHSKQEKKISAFSIESGKSTKASTKSLRKESNKDMIEPKPLLDIYARPMSLEHSPTSNYSNATIRQPSKMSSSRMLDTRKKNSQTYDDDSLRQSYQYPETYFIPPKDILQNKEEERRYSRERSNDQIRPTTTRRENEHQTGNIPQIYDAPNTIYPENIDSKSPPTTKLSKQKGKDNTERIKQTLTDLTCIEIENASKASGNYRENSKTPLNMPPVAQKVETTSSFKETPQVDATYIKHLDEFEIPIASDDLDLSIISKYDPNELKNRKEESRDVNNEERNENVTPMKNKETVEISFKGKPITGKVYDTENTYLSKDMRNKNVLKTNEPMESKDINAAKPKSGKLEDSDISSTLVSDEDKINIIQLVPPAETQKCLPTDYSPDDYNSKLEDEPTKTSDKIVKTANSHVSPNLAKDKTKLLMTIRLPSLENVLDVDVTNEKINKGEQIKHNGENEKIDTNIYPNTAKYVDNIRSSPNRKSFEEHTYKSQEVIDSKPINEDHNLPISEWKDDQIKKSLRTGETPKDQISNSNILVSEADDDKMNKISRTNKVLNKEINGSKNIKEERIQHSQISHKLEPVMVQKPFNGVPDVKGSEKKSVQDLNLDIIHSEAFNNLPSVETHNKVIEEKIDLKLRNTPSKDVEVQDKNQSKPDLMANQKQMQNTTPSETFHEQVLDKQYSKIEENTNINKVPSSTAKVDKNKTYSNIPIKGNKHIANTSDMTDENLAHSKDFNDVKVTESNDITKTTPNSLENFESEQQANEYIKKIENDNKVTSFEKSSDSFEKNQPLTDSTADSSQIKQQIIDKIKEPNYTSKITSENPAEFGKQVQDSKYPTNIENENKEITEKAFHSDDKKQPLTANTADQMKHRSIDKIKEPNHLNKITSENLEKIYKPLQDSKYPTNIENENKDTTFENAFDSDEKKQPLTASTADIDQIDSRSINKIKESIYLSKITTKNSAEFDNQVQDSKYPTNIGNENKETIEKAFYSDDKTQPLADNIADSGQIKLKSIDKIKDPNYLGKLTSENLEKNYKPVRDSKYLTNIENKNKETTEKALYSDDTKQPSSIVTADSGQIIRQSIDKIKEPIYLNKISTEILEKFDKPVQEIKYTRNIETEKVNSFEKVYDLDGKKQPLTSNTADSGQIKRQLIDTSEINNNKAPVRNSSQDNILSVDTEFSTSSANSIETNNLNYDANEKAPLNSNFTDSDNVIIKNTSLNDRKKNLTMNIQDTIPSDILHKPPLARTEDSDLRNDDINVIKPFKRNTFTIVASSTSLEKQEEPLSIQETNYTTDEQFQAKRDKIIASNDQTTTDSEYITRNDQQNFNDSKQETIKIDPILNVNTHSDTGLKLDDRSRESYNAMENQSKYLEPPENQGTDNIKIISSATSDDKLKNININYGNLASDIVSNDYNIVNKEILKTQDQTDNKMYNKEKLILKNLPDALVKQISELQGRSDDDIECLRTELKTHNNDEIVSSIISDKFDDTIADNTATQITHSQLRDNRDDLDIQISITNMSIKEAEGVSLAVLIKDTEKTDHEEKEASIGGEKSDSNYVPNAIEYGSRLLDIFEGKFDHELGHPKDTPVDIAQSIISGEPDKYTSKLLPVEKSGQIVPGIAELDARYIHANNQSVTKARENNVGGKMDINEVGSVYKDENSHIPEDHTIYYSENETGTDNLRKISDSGTMRSFNKVIDPKSDIIYSEYDQDIKIHGDGDLKNMSKSISIESFSKNIDKTSIVSKDGTKYYREYENPVKVSKNDDFKKISEQVLVGKFSAIIDEKSLMDKYNIGHIIEDDKNTKAYVDGALEQQFDADAIGKSDKVIDEQQLASEDSIKYSSKSALPSKSPIPAEKLSNVGQFGAKIHLDVKQRTDQNDSIGLGQELRVKTRQTVYSHNENILNKTDLKGQLSSPINKSKSEVFILNLALQSYVNDNNDTVIQTINPMVEPVRYTDDNITVVQSLIRHGHEIRIPVDVENDLSLKFTTKTHHISQNFNTDHNSSRKGRLSRNLSEHAHRHPEDINNSLAFIYESELIPLHNVIKNLTEEINILTTQQELLKDKMRGAKRTKSLRLIPVNKRCGCGRM